VREILTTTRLTLRELDEADLDFVASMLGHPEVMHFFPSCLTQEQSRLWIHLQQKRYAEDGFGYWLAVERGADEPVALAGIMWAEVEGEHELAIGYLVHRLYWRRGYATEAAAACRDHAFDAMGATRVVILVRPENLPSLGVARKIGMEIERRTLYARYEHFVLSLGRAQRPPALG
jgi:RimJ/RimL family protein N-acetyltransferase